MAKQPGSGMATAMLPSIVASYSVLRWNNTSIELLAKLDLKIVRFVLPLGFPIA